MKGIFFRISAFFMILALLAGNNGIQIGVTSEAPIRAAFRFPDLAKTRNTEAFCFYSDDYFRSPGTAANPHLRTMSLAMAMSAFESYREDKEDYLDRCENYEALMEEIGFSRLVHNEAFDMKPTEDSVGVAIGSRMIFSNRHFYTILAVGIRGASYEAEWANNVRVGTEGESKGFSAAKEQVLEFIREYEKKYGLKDHVKIWLAGYSRAGALSNMAAAEIGENPELYGTTLKDIYCYTFEAPQGVLHDETGHEPYIHNTVSPADVVPMIPLSIWGFDRAGYEQPDRLKNYTRDDLLLPVPGDDGYEERKTVMLERLAEIDPSIEYILDDFTAYRYTDPASAFEQVQFKEPEKISQGEFVGELTEWVNSNLPDSDRASYAEHYQEAFSTVARIILGSTYAQADEMIEACGDMVKDWQFYVAISAIAVTISLNNTLPSELRNDETYHAALQASGEVLASSFIEQMRKKEIGLTEQEYENLSNAVGPLLLFMDQLIEDDITRYQGYHILTLVLNMDQIIQAHYPEINLAWVESLDSYYTEGIPGQE